MAVEVRYHVIRDGEEVAVYLTKKEADEHDKMLDIAYELSEFIAKAPGVALDEDVLEELAIHLSQNRAEVIRILRAQKPRKPAPVKTPPATEADGKPAAPEKKRQPEKLGPVAEGRRSDIGSPRN
jgi:dsDNA-binding SOS-regulon protein